MYFDRSAIYLCFMNSYLLSWFMFVDIYHFKLEIWFYRSITTIQAKKIILQYKLRIVTHLQVCKVFKSFMLRFDRKQWTSVKQLIARTWTQPRSPSADEWIRKLWYIYTMEYYSAIKKNSFESVLMRWMKLEPIIQGEVSQKGKDHYSILMHIYGI